MTLIVAIGGVRSGKSAWAESQAIALAAGDPVTVLATADPADTSMADRIARHAARRPGNWSVAEAHGSTSLAAALPASGVALLDGLGGWIAALLERGGVFVDDPVAAREARRRTAIAAHEALTELIAGTAVPGRAVVVVSEEAGLGPVPPGLGTAAWLDLLGELNQRLVAAAELAVVVVAGRPLPLTDRALDNAATRPVADFQRHLHDQLRGPSLTVLTLNDQHDPSDTGAVHEQPHQAPALMLPEERTGAPALVLPSSSPDRNGGEPEDYGSLRMHGDRLVRPGDRDHAINIVAEGPPAWLLAAVHQAVSDDLSRYPDAAPAEAALAAGYGRAPQEVVVTNGAAQALWLLPAGLRPTLAACVCPLFTEAEAALRAHGTPVVRVLRHPDRDFAIDPSEVPREADLVIVGNPAAASGTLSAREAILALRRPGRVIVIDEAFMDLVPGEAESLVSEPFNDVMVIRSFTKSLSIPGLRAGAAVGPPALIASLRSVQPPWSANALTCAALVALAAHPEELRERALRADAERQHLDALLRDLPGVRHWPSSTNHLLLGIAGGRAIAAALHAQQIAVRPCGSFPGLSDDHLRITARDPAANALLVSALAGLLTTSAL